MSIQVQIYSIFISLIFGIYLGFAIDIVKNYVKTKKEIINTILTIVLISSNAFVYFYLLYRVNFGVVHIYFYLSIFLGMSFYYYFVKNNWLKRVRKK